MGHQDGLADELAPGPEKSYGGARTALLVLAAVQFTNIVDFMIVMPLGPQLMRTLHVSPAQFAWIVSSYTFAACTAGVLAALVIDRFDRKVAFLSLYAGFLVGTLLCGLSTTYATLVAARIATGAFGGIMGGLALAIVGDIFPESQRGAATGALMSAFAVASVVGVPFGLYLGTVYDWHAPFLVLAGLGLVVLIVGGRALPSIRGHMGHHEDEGAVARLWTTLTNRNHLRAYTLVITLMFGGFLVIPFISPYLVSNVGVAETKLPLVYIVGGILSLFAAPAIGRLADKYGKLRIYRIVAPVAAVLMLTITNLPRVPLAWAVITAAALMVGNAGRMVVALAMVTASAEPKRRGSFMSLNSSVQHFSAGLGAFVAGEILAKAPDGSLIHYPTVGVLAFAATVISLVLAGRLRVAHPSDIHQSFGTASPGTEPGTLPAPAPVQEPA